MKLIRTITEKDLKIKTTKNRCIQKRFAARAVIFNKKGDIAFITVLKKGFHKIPGGGVESGEDIISALKREIYEESGQKIRVIKEVGYIIEKRAKINWKQKSYCYICKSTNDRKQTAFTDKEKKDGFKMGWFPLDKAIDALRNDKPRSYHAKFMKERDLTFLLEAKKILENKQ